MPALSKPVAYALPATVKPKLFAFSLPEKRPSFRLAPGLLLRPINFQISATKKQIETRKLGEGFDLGWVPAFPHVLTASMANFLFGYHIGVMNGPIVSIARELGFEGDRILEGLVVSIFIAGAFVGSISCGSLVDKLGCRRTFQIDTMPLVLGALVSAQAHSVNALLWGRFLVGLGIGVNTVLVPIYISEVAPTKYRGSLGSLCQIGTCLGIIFSLFLAIPAEDNPHWWRTMFHVASAPGLLLAFGMQFAVESPRWLCRVGQLNNAEAIISKIWGKSDVNHVIKEFQSVISNDVSNSDSSWLELLEEPHSRGCMKVVICIFFPMSYIVVSLGFCLVLRFLTTNC